MKLEITFLQSKLARRIFWLFVLCALMPISVLALVSLRNVSAELNEQCRRQLHEAGREEALTIYERLIFLEANMKLVSAAVHPSPGPASVPPSGSFHVLTPEAMGHFEGMEVVTPDGNHRSLFGKALLRFELSAEEQRFLHSGKNVLSAIPCFEAGPCIFLSRELDSEHPSDGILTAQINAPYLWGIDDLRRDVDICVLDPAGRTLFCSAETPASFPARVTQSFSGEFEWKLEGREFLAHYWNLPLASAFFAPHWTIVSSEAKPDILAPLSRFRTTFLLVFLLALWIVVLLSLVQIRRNLIPLGKLKDSTVRISEGNFQTRVQVDSGDEFQELAASFNFMAGRIEKQLNSLKLVNEIDRAILSAWDIEKIVDTLAKRLGELLPLDLVGVILFDTSESLTASAYIYGPHLNSERSVQRIALTPKEVLELSKEPRVSILTASSNVPSHLKPLSARGMKSFMRVPVVIEGRIAAIFVLAQASAFAWTEEDQEQARQLADQAAVAISNSRLVNDLQQLQWGTLTALARAIDAKSPWTLGHSERVTNCAMKIAQAMGLPPRELDIIRRGGLIHDVGKIGTPVSILDKPGKLTDEEMTEMRKHVIVGARILQPIPGLADSMSIVLQHHEWVNGGGYPNGLKGEDITLHARIFAVADCYDALISDRPYRAGMPFDRVMQILQEGANKQFDPQVLAVFRKLMEQERKQEKFDEVPEAAVSVS